MKYKLFLTILFFILISCEKEKIEKTNYELLTEQAWYLNQVIATDDNGAASDLTRMFLTEDCDFNTKYIYLADSVHKRIDGCNNKESVLKWCFQKNETRLYTAEEYEFNGSVHQMESCFDISTLNSTELILIDTLSGTWKLIYKKESFQTE